MAEVPIIPADARAMRVGVALSRYHSWATDRLYRGAVERFVALGGSAEAIVTAPAPGAWELIAVSHALASRADLDGVVAIGAVIRGETPHFDYICQALATGLPGVMVETKRPVSFGVLTCETREQVEARSGGAVGNKGAEAMNALVETIVACRHVARSESVR